jgi:hypothetical protein
MTFGGWFRAQISPRCAKGAAAKLLVSPQPLRKKPEQALCRRFLMRLAPEGNMVAEMEHRAEAFAPGRQDGDGR